MNTQKQTHIPPAAFHFLTNYYDWITELFGFGRKFKRRVLELLQAHDGQTILDVGLGTGTLLLLAAEMLPQSTLIGVDPDHNAVTIARKKLAPVASRVQLHEISAERLPFPDESIDLAVTTLVFHHLSRQAKRESMKEIYRVLKPNGRFLLVDFGKPMSSLSRILLYIGSFIDGRDNMKANLEGLLPMYLTETGFSVASIAKPYRGVQFLMARK